MKARIFFWSITSALAGFLFGFDTVVISGAEQTIQALWESEPGDPRLRHGLGALRHGPGLAARRLAHRPLRAQGDAALDSACSTSSRRWGADSRAGSRMFIAARFIGGLGIGISTVAAPLYISEISPPGLSRTAGGHVPVQHRLRHPRRVRLERAAGGHRRERLALDARRRGVPVDHLHARCASAFPRARAGCIGTERRPRGGLEGAPAHRARRHPGADRGPRGRDPGGVLRARRRLAASGRWSCASRSCWPS